MQVFTRCVNYCKWSRCCDSFIVTWCQAVWCHLPKGRDKQKNSGLLAGGTLAARCFVASRTLQWPSMSCLSCCLLLVFSMAAIAINPTERIAVPEWLVFFWWWFCFCGVGFLCFVFAVLLFAFLHNSFNWHETVIRPGESQEGDGQKKSCIAFCFCFVFGLADLCHHCHRTTYWTCKGPHIGHVKVHNRSFSSWRPYMQFINSVSGKYSLTRPPLSPFKPLSSPIQRPLRAPSSFLHLEVPLKPPWSSLANRGPIEGPDADGAVFLMSCPDYRWRFDSPPVHRWPSKWWRGESRLAPTKKILRQLGAGHHHQFGKKELLSVTLHVRSCHFGFQAIWTM